MDDCSRGDWNSQCEVMDGSAALNQYKLHNVCNICLCVLLSAVERIEKWEKKILNVDDGFL